MQPRRLTERIELGQHEGRVGFIMYFTDGTSEAFLFDRKTAQALFSQGLTLVEQLQEAQHANSSGVSLGEAVTMRLVP